MDNLENIKNDVLSIPELINSKNKAIKSRIKESNSFVEINALTTLIVLQERMRTANFVTPSYDLAKGGDQRPDFAYELRETQR